MTPLALLAAVAIASPVVGVNPDADPSVWPQVGMVRLWDMGVTWAQLEPARGVFDFTLLDRLVTAAEARHMQVILTLGQTPTWAAPGAPNYTGGTPTTPPLREWDRYVTTLTERYGDRITAYEVWNEPNLRLYYTGTVKELADLSRHAANDIRRHSDSLVLSPAWTSAGYGWMGEWIAAGGAKGTDAVAFHDYPRWGYQARAAARNFQRTLRAHRLRLDLWVTELGCWVRTHCGAKTLAAQRQWASRAFAGLRGMARTVVWYTALSSDQFVGLNDVLGAIQ